MHSCHLSHKHEQFLFKNTFSKFMIFKVKNTFEPNVLQIGYKKIIHSSNPFALLIINIKILSNF